MAKSKREYEVVCKYCGDKFYTTDRRYKYCCDECKQSWQREWQREYYQKRAEEDEGWKKLRAEKKRLRYHERKEHEQN